MNPLAVGCAIAAVLAGPPLYAQWQSGGQSGTSALIHYAIVAGLCTIGTALIMNLMTHYQREWEDKDEAEAREAAQAAAEAEAKRAAEEDEARRS
ncbi:hypothetical protein KIH74_20810 [Kineosporia sp. J2-2]|uniref:Uncharacterized protein n=1 Tax=Kineosporia corallincola TaxID=2835133 RepID=A0ABS5TJV7_9ACTN|nr:hypothetical protein [Kineosporia corallincola]MBT0771391.1 hypothetical protein [Kineosporia corallincola]